MAIITLINVKKNKVEFLVILYCNKYNIASIIIEKKQKFAIISTK